MRGKESSFQGHPNSIQAKAWRTPEIRDRIKANRKKFMEDSSAMEVWFRNGCGAAIQVDHQDYDLD